MDSDDTRDREVDAADLSPRHRAWARLTFGYQIRALIVFAAALVGMFLWIWLRGSIEASILWAGIVLAAVWWALRRNEPQARTPVEVAVLAALKADPRVNANLLIVRVEGRVAHLAGRQDTVQAREAAAEAAAAVRGVSAVENEIEVLPSV